MIRREVFHAIVSALVVALCLVVAPRVADAEPLKVLVAVGHRSGVTGEAPLKHAVRDAKRVRDVFVQLGGVKPENAILLEEPTAAALFTGLDKATAIAKTTDAKDVTLIFYFSGHGDRERIHLGAERVALADLDAKLAAAPAALRIVIADACRAAVRPKGIADDEPFAIRLGATGERASGVVHIHASADGEVAQESDDLGGAVFTYYWVTGLSGAADADGDARVTLAESYAFAYSQTLYRSARASGVVQRPAAQFDLREAAPVVLTTTANASTIKMPRASDVHYLVYGLGSRTVIGELWSSPDRAVVLAVAPGKYVVQRRAAGRSAATEITVAKNEQREIASSDFQAVPEEVLTRKGGEIDLRPNEIGIAYAPIVSRLVGLGHELTLRYGYRWDNGLALSLAAVGGVGDKSEPGQDAHVDWIGADVLLEERFRVGSVALRAGVGPRVLGVLQTLERADADRLTLAGYDPERRFRAVAAGAHALVGARVPLGSVPWIEIDLRGDALGAELDGSVVVVWSAGAGLALGLSF
jgi:hypothetical protein